MQQTQVLVVGGSFNQDGLPSAIIDEYARRLAAPGALRGGISYFRSHVIDAALNMADADRPLAMPVMTVAGASSAGRALAEGIRPLARDLEEVVIERCGHYVAEERPRELAEHLLRFLAD